MTHSSSPPLPSEPLPFGYKRSPSVTASIDFFESHSKSTRNPGTNRFASTSTSSVDRASQRMIRSTTSPRLGGPGSASASSSPQQSFSSLADGSSGSRGVSRSSSMASLSTSEAGPSRRGSPRLNPSRPGSRGIPTPTGGLSRLPRGVVGQAAQDKEVFRENGRGSVDSTASSTGRAAIGLGMNGVSGIPRPGSSIRGEAANGVRRASDTTTAIPSSSRLRQPRPSLPSNSLSTSRQIPPPGSYRHHDQDRSTNPSVRDSPRQKSAHASSASRNSPRPTTSPRLHASPRISTTRPATSPSRMISPTRPSAPSLSISHPTPDRDRALPSTSRDVVDLQSSRGSIGSATSGAGSRRTSYRLSKSVDSDHSTSDISGRLSPSLTVEEESSTNDLGKGSPSSPPRKGRKPSQPTSPPARPLIEIPERRSSAPSSSKSSPRSSSIHFPPLISPRKSSIKAFDENPGIPSSSSKSHPAHHRRASSNITLGDVLGESRNNQYAYSSSRHDRKSPGLSIQPPSPAVRRASDATTRPSPPVPAKSPLRSLSRHSSMGRKPSLLSRKSSRGSTLDTDGSTIAVMDHDEEEPIPPLPPSYASEDRRISSSTVVVRNEDVELTPEARDLETMDDKRFTTLTYASMYSQDSGPATATFPDANDSSVPSSAVEGGYDGVEDVRTDRRVKRQSRMDDLWGRSHAARQSGSTGRSPVHTADGLHIDVPQHTSPRIYSESPNTASTALDTSTTTSDASRQAVLGHGQPREPTTPTDRRSASHTPVRSPSAPMLNGSAAPSKAAKLLGIEPSEGRGVRRQQTVPAPLLPSAMSRSPTAPSLSPRAASTPNSGISKRTHLIREIASTERAYATDLALIRDAYLSRYLRPPSTVSSGNDNGSTSAISIRRGSVTTADKRLSGTDWPANAAPSAFSPPIRTPSDTSGGPYGYFPPSSATSIAPTAAATSVSSLKHPQVSPGESSRSSMIMPPPVGKPLSPADVKAVFLNIDQLASGAEEMARAFEAAMGEEDAGPGSAREGESGSDKLGEVFTSLIPRLRPVYLYYCSRQHTASTRLVELLAEPSTAAHLNECWAVIKNQTHAWNLDSMLIKPVQRITKYPLLFEDLLSCTTPVHPDYFNIRSAAELAKTIATEIDEAKRRKDVVASALGGNKRPKTPKAALPSPNKESSSKMGLKMFRKEKPSPGSTPSIGMSASASSMALADTSAPPAISKTSFGLMRDYIARLEESDQVVRRVGKEVVLWTAGAKEILVSQQGLLSTWSKVLTLDQTGSGQSKVDTRVEALKFVLEGVIADAWANLNEEVRERIMPMFSKLLESSTNPRRVIAKRESKYPDYTRYFTLVKARKTPDRALLLSARDYYALHSQLIDELPRFLEGYSRIFDLALVAFAEAQARYFEGCKLRLGEYAQRWIARPRKSPVVNLTSPNPDRPNIQHKDSHDGEVDVKTGRGIVKAWHDAWLPYAEAMDHFQCTRPARAMASRIASFNARTGSRPTSRTSSPAPGPPGLTHSASFTGRIPSGSTSGDRSSTHSRSTSTSASISSRARSASLLGPGPPPLPSPTHEKSRFNILRAGSSSSKTPKSQQPSPRPSRPSSLHVPPSLEQRYSFGLPKIPDSAFDGLSKIGLPSPNPSNAMLPPQSPAKKTSPIPSGQSNGVRIASDSINNMDFLAGKYKNKTGFEEDDSPTINSSRREILARAGSASHLSTPGSDSRLSVNYGEEVMTMRRRSSARDMTGLEYSNPNAGLGLGDVQPRRPSAPTSTSTPSVPAASTRRPFPVPPPGPIPPRSARRASEASGGERDSRGAPMDASEGWRDEPVLYQCGCVAEFDPNEVGNKRYRGLRFLPMAHGDLFDIFHEVGRIDELPKFPYPEIGVDNDGVLVGRGEDGSIGLLICSFLEPLRE